MARPSRAGTARPWRGRNRQWALKGQAPRGNSETQRRLPFLREEPSFPVEFIMRKV